MQVRFAATRPEGHYDLALPVAQGGEPGAGLVSAVNAQLLRDAARAQRFEGEAGAIAELFADEGGVRRILLVGVGRGELADYDKAGGALAARLLTSGTRTLVVDPAGISAGAEQLARLAAGAAMRGWRIDTYRTRLPAKQQKTLEELVVIGDGTAWPRHQAVVDGMALTRELVSEPPNVIYPESFVERCRHLADLGVEITVLDDDQMRALGMHALLGVNQGSARAARLLAMRWDGTGGTVAEPIALVGKGVTFDSGGISLKPGPGMEDMKWDMGGAGAVAGAMKTLALRRARAHVVGVVGLVENMPDGNAQRPGDIVRSMSGQTIEILNTDAEGRLVLADVLTWVQRTHKPRTIVDLATLTGAMIISLGNEHAGLFANHDGLADELLAAGREAGDPLWRFPLSEAYNKLIDSPIADMKNVGPRGAGSITAAQFLQRFIDDGVRWAHLDIAGMVWADKPGAVWDKGATGFGVRLLDRFVARHEG
ncbi:leucyl aminopeptidase [Sphingomonas changnyeongensis]|uniref:Probable cytosol aminopeptidase n=1 Tax=Sphingomonas changnyeongensis TaxID=2698679 RepID=A0A7Z2NYA2_9SPHN|nr:leucyl aminopeptidase [Sphingomonas changnyeongensis]QHL91504.1 leucyl aminopeptidase [Sphingomonas changnyeongensis]